MRHLLSVLAVAAVCCGCLLSCNEKPKNYHFVKIANDGKEVVEDIAATNDTDALKMYLDRMEKVIIANIDKQEAPFKAMYVVSPSGDTLNTNKELLEAVMKTLPAMQEAPAREMDTIVLGTAKPLEAK